MIMFQMIQDGQVSRQTYTNAKDSVVSVFVLTIIIIIIT